MSAAQKPVPTPGQAEELLAALEGVVSAHVVTEAGGRIVEIHILASGDLHPKQVVRNVESALSAGLGIGIDRRVVSVAQIRSTEGGSGEGGEAGDGGNAGGVADGAEALPAGGAAEGNGISNGRRPVLATEVGAPGGGASVAAARRLEYVRYESRREIGSFACEVVVRDGGEEIRGRGAGPDTAAGRAEAAARAVMDALGKARPELRLALEGAVLSSSRGREYVIIAAHAVQDRETVSLCGAAPVSRSPEEAAILAALQATNRWSG